MKLLIYKGLILFAALVILASCSKDKQLMFSEMTSVYVEASVDSTAYTFATSPVSVVSDTINIPLRIIGTAATTDREVTFVPKPGATAKEGYHYKIGKVVIKANEFSTSVPVYVYRKPGLKDSVVRVELELKKNADFNLGFSDQLNYKITISDILSKPTIWDAAWSAYFGTYSKVKFLFLLQVTGRTDWNAYPYPADTRFMSQRAKNALLEYNQAHGDMIDEFGQVVVFPN
ncbi:protein of unknown function [Pedobacter sp. ok626]|uniref:DUF4843 domain-containing protein n=1 Tax=Pedobacter sp. ok626 TaxID=1761882 RepID=UPI00087E8A70|nr:DUF4843 domain-containing protein [Pedobacter sp. ok626]SDJ13434.1 protein of unknown function [Pedobacter sp. ok626]